MIRIIYINTQLKVNYKRIYDQIIDRRRAEPYNGYTERHHVIPKCLGGPDTKDNIVRLSAREHYLCHLLLTRIYSEGPAHYKMIKGFLMMSTVKSESHQRISPSRNYQHLKDRYYRYVSEIYQGEGNSRYGCMWISNPDTGESKTISRGDDIPDGFYPGRWLEWKTCKICAGKYITSGVVCIKCREERDRDRLEKKLEASREKHKADRDGCRRSSEEVRKERPCLSCGKMMVKIDKDIKYCSPECYISSGSPSTARVVQDDLGNVYNTLTKASKAHGVTVEAIRYRIKIGKYKYLN